MKVLYRILKLLIYSITFLFLILPCIGGVYQYIMSNVEKHRFSPPGDLVDVGGYKLHVQSSGTGTQTVVLDSGVGLFSIDWCLVQPEIAKISHVCSYDRAGYGWSDASPYPRTSEQIVKELYTLLERIHAPKPYILVGHSFGGINMQLFANYYPDLVAGIILVDSSHEDQLNLIPPPPKSWVGEKHPKLALFLTRIGVPRIIMQLFKDTRVVDHLFGKFPDDIKNIYRSNCCRTSYVKTLSSENTLFETSLNQVKNSFDSYGSKPLVVITAGKKAETSNIFSDEAYEAWLENEHIVWQTLQKDLLNRSKNSCQVIANQSDHLIPQRQPELIIEMIQKLIKENKINE